jgi:hypothetical protein
MIDLSNIYFVSNSHLRYENGVQVNDLQVCRRAVKIEANINGCKGYNIKGGEGYIVTVFNLDGNHPVWGDNVQVSPKPMKIITQSFDKVVLRGYKVEAMSPFGWMDVDLSDYGLSVFHNNGEVEKCILHMYDRKADIEYLKGRVMQEEYDYSELNFYVLKQSEFNSFVQSCTEVKIWEEEEKRDIFDSFYRQAKKTGRYHISFNSNVTEKLVGISDNDKTVYNVTWELLREEEHKGKKFLILCGWGDPVSTGGRYLPQFNYYETGVEKKVFAHFIVWANKSDPEYFSINKMRNIIGMEGFKFENGKMIFK